VNLRNAVGIVLLAGAAAASYWYSRPPPAEPAVQANAGAELPGYYLHGVRFTGTDEHGRVALRIHADSLAELPDDEQLSLDNEAPWSISASHATAPKDRSRVDLVGNVDMRSAPTDGSKPMQILTAAMQFLPHESQITTDGPVEVRMGDWQLKGVRLRALLNAKKLALESDVHARFTR